ncbi:MAG: adenylyl-sulfate kinase [Pseudomonadales bacterium]
MGVGRQTSPLKLVVVGHVDHGKSTMIGRLLYDTGSLPEGKVEELRRASARRHVPIEWSFALDALQAERDQAVTIDTTQIWFNSESRSYVIIDAPGHVEFLRNMLSGAANAEAAVLVVDVQESAREQSFRHAYLLRLLGLQQVAVVVNKMDGVEFRAAPFRKVGREITEYLQGIGLKPTAVVPISARDGDNLATRSTRTEWYAGPTLIDVLDGFSVQSAPVARSLRLPIQDVYRFDNRRILVGLVESGIIRVGDELLLSPSNRIARVQSIETWGRATAPILAKAGRAVAFTIDQQFFVERGEIASHSDSPPKLSNVFRANLFWLGQRPLTPGAVLKLKLATKETMVSIQAIERVINTRTLSGHAADEMKCSEVGEVVLRSREILALDNHADYAATGRFVLVDGFETVGGGVISTDGYPDQRQLHRVKATNLTEVEHLLTPEARAWRNGHQGAVIWMTGLSGAGKSTLAMRLEQRLFNKGFHAYVLDGDNVRKGVNADLGFAPEDRIENIRRVSEMAALIADAGLIVITAFISPYIADRGRAREASGEAFYEVYVKADLETCEKRDPKGLYRRARTGDIKEFTGISAPYQAPLEPDVVVDTVENGIDECVDQLLAYVQQRVTLKIPSAAEVA